jgi:hypothetical protein
VIAPLAVAAVLKLAAGAPLGLRWLGRSFESYLMRRAPRDVAEQEELWWRTRADLGTARELGRRLTRDAERYAASRRYLDDMLKAHPEYVVVFDQIERHAQAEIARLDEMVRRVHGGSGEQPGRR